MCRAHNSQPHRSFGGIFAGILKRTVFLILLTSLGIGLTGCTGLQPAATKPERIQQVQDLNDTFSLAKADAQVLCDESVLPPAACQTISSIEASIEPLLQQLETAAQSDDPTAINYRRLFFDLQPPLLRLTIEIAKGRAPASAPTTSHD